MSYPPAKMSRGMWRSNAISRMKSGFCKPGGEALQTASANDSALFVRRFQARSVQMRSAKISYIHVCSLKYTYVQLAGGKKLIFFRSWLTATTQNRMMAAPVRSLRPFAAIHILGLRRRPSEALHMPACTRIFPLFSAFFLQNKKFFGASKAGTTFSGCARLVRRRVYPSTPANPVDASPPCQQYCWMNTRRAASLTGPAGEFESFLS